MYCDKLLQFSAAQAVTAAAASTNYVDLGAVRDIGTGEDLYVVVVAKTALTDGGSNTGTNVILYGDSSTTFTPDGQVTLFSFAQAAAAGTVKYAKLSPGSAPLQYRYVELYYDPQGASLTGGTFDAYITTDISKFTAYADGVTIS
jgi:hypothetical protein